MSLRTRHLLFVLLFFAGGLTIGFIALAVDERVALALPAWMVAWFLLMFYGVRCPRCKLPATVMLGRLGRFRIWIPTSRVGDRCAGCGGDLRRSSASDERRDAH